MIPARPHKVFTFIDSDEEYKSSDGVEDIEPSSLYQLHITISDVDHTLSPFRSLAAYIKELVCEFTDLEMCFTSLISCGLNMVSA